MPQAKAAKAQPEAQDPVNVDPKHYKVSWKIDKCESCESTTGLARNP